MNSTVKLFNSQELNVLLLVLIKEKDLIGEDYVHDQDTLEMLRVIFHETEGNIQECLRSTFPADVASRSTYYGR